jgi:hypothetical protein
LGRFTFQAGELVLADAGYSSPPGITAVVEKGADVCVRLNPQSLPLLDEKGRPFPLLKKLKTLRRAGHTVEWGVWVRSGEQPIAGRLCGIRKSEAAVERAQRRLTRQQQKGKGKITPEKREYARYVLVFTTLPRSEASARQVLDRRTAL